MRKVSIYLYYCAVDCLEISFCFVFDWHGIAIRLTSCLKASMSFLRSRVQTAEFPERGPANFLNGYHLISSMGTT